MATVYKRKRDAAKRRSFWYIGFTDYRGKRKTVRGYSDKGATERLAASLEEEARLIRDGLKPIPLTNDNEFVEQAIASFKEHLQDKDVSTKQVGEVVGKLNRLAQDCRWQSVRQISDSDVERRLSQYRSEGMGKRTSNHYLRAIKQFASWLVATRRLRENPLTQLKMLNADTDRRHARRALAPEELSRLVLAASMGRVIEGISGPDRAMMYLIAAWTGYRKGEIGSLRESSLALKAEPPTITVDALYSKRRRSDVQVLHPELAEQITVWLATKKLAPNELLFPISARSGGTERKTAKMMRRDLNAARKAWLKESADEKEKATREKSEFLLYLDSQKRFADFHANRHTFITNLGRAGVSAKTAQTLARHSDIRLTLNTYSHSELVEQQAAIERLSGYLQRYGSAPEAQSGTNGQQAAKPSEQQADADHEDPSPKAIAATPLSNSCHKSTAKNITTPEGIRTPNPRFRRPMLYPIELRVQLTDWEQDRAKTKNWQPTMFSMPLAMPLLTD